MHTGFTILFHSSKTMRASSEATLRMYSQPPLIEKTIALAAYLKTVPVDEIATCMKISPALAEKTHVALQNWHQRRYTLPAMDAFLGDMYSGLQAHTFTAKDRAYATQHLFILSGLYGVLRALDAIHPYRLEMGYKLPDAHFRDLYVYWGESIVDQLPDTGPVLNLSVPEYTKELLPRLKDRLVITPVFLTVKAGKPQPVVVHSKIARGAFARWVLTRQIETVAALQDFTDLGYHYNATLSTPTQPVYVTQEFQGLGLSVRAKK